MLVMVAPMFWIGLYPNPLLRRIEPSVIELLARVDDRVAAAQPTGASGTDASPDGAEEEAP
jgi:NADH:ubiquinone oxidoreductase subunit 4 (subunit M)